MAKQRSRPTRRREVRGGRRKPCAFCRDKVDQIDYKDEAVLRQYISERGRIRSRRLTGSCRRHQAQLATAIKRARELALLPYVAEGKGGLDRDKPRSKRDDR